MNKTLKYINIWLKAARAPFLVVSFIPAVLGGVVAWKDGFFDWTIFLLATIGIVLAHSAADFIDDYFDFKNGNLANKEQQFHDSPLIRGEITPRQVIWATIICLVPALAIGVYLFVIVGMPVVYMTAIGVFIVFFYTSPPFRLNYRGLGETALFVAFGPMIVFGVYFVLAQQFSWEPIILSIPLGIFTMNVGLVSNIFDYSDDVASGKHTFPVRFGQTKAVTLLSVASVVGFLVIVFAGIWQIVSIFTLSVLLLGFLGINVLKDTSKFNELNRYTKAMGNAIALSSLFGILLTISYIVQIAI